MKYLSLLFSACLAVVACVSCTKQAFSLDAFIDNVTEVMQNKAVGYCVVIARDGRIEHVGEAGVRIQGTASGAGDVPQDKDQPMYTGSISKNITALAVLKLLDELKLGVDETVWRYLPGHWRVHPSFEPVTFRMLLQHRSGIARNTRFDYPSLKTLIEQGVDSDRSYAYSGANYALFRIIIPGLIKPFESGDDVWLDEYSAHAYRDFVTEKLFVPLGISNVDTRPVEEEPTLYYQKEDPWGTPGWNIGDRTRLSGGGGWFVSPLDLARFYAAVEHTEKVIPTHVRELRDDLFLGWSRPLSVSFFNDHGVYHALNGALSNVSDQGFSGLYKKFDDNRLLVVVLMNSRGGEFEDGAEMNAAFREAYDDAWD